MDAHAPKLFGTLLTVPLDMLVLIPTTRQAWSSHTHRPIMGSSCKVVLRVAVWLSLGDTSRQLRVPTSDCPLRGAQRRQAGIWGWLGLGVAGFSASELSKGQSSYRG